MEKLDNRFQEVFTRLKLVSQDKLAVDRRMIGGDVEGQYEVKHIGDVIGEKEKELERINDILSRKTSELDSVSVKLEESRSALKMVESELAKKRAELEGIAADEEALSKAWKEKLKIYDEIDKSLGILEENGLKTKKLSHESEEEEG